MAQTIQFRRDLAANWTSSDPILEEGELGFETDTGLFKIGNGTDNWVLLDYSTANSGNFTSALMDSIPDPGAAPVGKMRLYAHSVSNRIMPKFVGPSGLDSILQPFLARNKVGYWCPPGNSTTLPGVFGFTAYTAVGTLTTRNITTANYFTRMRRLGFASAAGAGSLCSTRVAAAQITTGTGTMGGFHKIIRFGISDAAIVATARTFIGISSNIAAATNVEPSTLLNSVGVGHGAADTNFKIFYGGSTAQTPIDLGANFPSNTSNTDVYELSLFSSPSEDNIIHWEFRRLNTGHVASGTIVGNGGIILPANSTLLTYAQNWRSNNATAAAVALDIMSDYIETDS